MYATVLQAEVYVILACDCEIQTQFRPEKSVSNCSDSQASLKAIQADKTLSPLVHLCQKALNDVSTQHTVGLYWVLGHAGVQENRIADKLPRGGSVLKFVGPAPSSRPNIGNKIKCWLDNQHLAMWHGPGSTKRQA